MKSENPLISVIVPIYNAEDYLPLCIESILSQTYKNIEVILVNDGSKDSSLRLCREYAEKDARIKVIDKPNSGVSNTRNAGIDAAMGEYLMFCDSDDCVSPNWCRNLLEAQTDEMMTMCKYQMVDTNKMTKGLVKPENDKDGEVAYIDRKDFIFYRDRGFFSPFNKLFIKSIVDQFQIKFPSELSLGEDLAFNLEYLKATKGNIRLIPDVLYFYRTTGGESLSRKAPTIEQCNAFYQMLTSSMSELGVQNAEAWKIRDDIVIQDYEKRLVQISMDGTLSLPQKYRLTRQIMTAEGYRVCCNRGTVSPNKIYQWMLRNRQALLLTVYYNMKGTSLT